MNISRKLVFSVILMLAAALTVIIIAVLGSDRSFDLRDGEYKWELDYFGAEKYSELHQEISDADRAELMPLYQKIDKTFSLMFDSDEAAKAECGNILYLYSVHDTPGADHETHTLKLLTGKVSGDDAVLWISYIRRIYASDGELLAGSGSEDAPCKVRLEAKKQDGSWIVTNRMEHP